MVSNKIYEEWNEVKHHLEKLVNDMRKDRLEFNDRQTERELQAISLIREFYRTIDDMRRENGEVDIERKNGKL